MLPELEVTEKVLLSVRNWSCLVKMDQGFYCFKCGESLSIDSIGRRDTCPNCNSDVRVCKNCTFYDIKAYNECREPQAERVLEKERANFCGYFKPRIGKSVESGDSTKDILKNLDDLFKK